MDKKNVGLYEKYRVERFDGEPVDWCFVLEETDPLAIPALLAYADAAEAAGYGPLATDLRARVAAIEELRRIAHAAAPELEEER